MSDEIKIKHINWRDGRPRFSPSPTLRALGYVGRDLRDANGGRWHSRHEAIAFSHDVSEEAKQKKERLANGRPLIVKPAKPTNLRGYVYFLRSSGRIKIGFTTNPLKRLMTLKTAVAHQIDGMAVIPGTERDERRAHMNLAKYRKHGEWFDCHPRVTEVMIRSLTAGKLTIDEQQEKRDLSHTGPCDSRTHDAQQSGRSPSDLS